MAWESGGKLRILVISIAKLLLLRIFCRKVVWVRHNFWPHDLPRRFLRQSLLMLAMRLFATDIVAHRKLSGGTTKIPHPLYFELQLPIVVRDIEYLYFGAIKRYKGLTELVAIWPREYPLIVVGSVDDIQLFKEIIEIVRLRALRVQFHSEYLPESELNAILLRTRYVVLPHRDDAMIVTGAFFHAVSFGANILARDSEFSRSAKETFSFINIYSDITIKQTILTSVYLDPEQVVQEVRTQNGLRQCVRAWKQLLCGTCI
jgi:beta-1,4-mannosyltransferase